MGNAGTCGACQSLPEPIPFVRGISPSFSAVASCQKLQRTATLEIIGAEHYCGTAEADAGARARQAFFHAEANVRDLEAMPPTLVHCVQQQLQPRDICAENVQLPAGLQAKPAVWDSPLPNCRGFSADIVEFIARGPAARGSHQVRLNVLYNDVEVLERGVRLAGTKQYFNFRTTGKAPLWNVVLEVEMPDDVEDDGLCTVPSEQLNMKPLVQLDEEFGLRVNGVDLLPCVTVVEATYAGSNPVRGRSDATRDAVVAARRGTLHLRTATTAAAAAPPAQAPAPSPQKTRFVFEPVIEFIVSGITGRESLDVYVNGLTTLCQEHIQLGNELTPRVLRYTIAPASFTIRNVVLLACWDGAPGGGIFVDAGFGFMVGGQDCLASMTLIDEAAGGGALHCTEGLKARLPSEGYYRIMPYRRIRKPYDPNQAQA
eukprot:NODE_7260_length_1595_cov_5.209809.p1 GENE.NODE_7260_length_1595_cov_5.209809~~NODE_7260_length_1595_cov_5.209809.p1  ORF type:complete len:454 (+),score=140.36 NODE_7260_length_1595_cov_5.209809:78-1364(+)